MDKLDTAYATCEGLRWWPENELARFIGKTYGVVPFQTTVKKGLRALDLGCGNGRNSWLLYEAGFSVDGIERSAEALTCMKDYMQRRHCEDVYYDYGQATDLSSYGTQCFDLVVDCQTIQHLSVEEHFHAYTEVARVLKKGGRFWSMHWRDGHAEKLYDHWYPELRHWALSDLRWPLKEAGLGIVDESRAVSIVQDVIVADWWVLSMVKV